MISTLLALALSPAIAHTPEPAVGSLPSDVLQFIDNRELCYHLAGEIPDPAPAYDQLRKEIIDSINTTCKGTDERLRKLRKKYASNKEVIDALSGYETRIEATVKYECKDCDVKRIIRLMSYCEQLARELPTPESLNNSDSKEFFGKFDTSCKGIDAAVHNLRKRRANKAEVIAAIAEYPYPIENDINKARDARDARDAQRIIQEKNKGR